MTAQRPVRVRFAPSPTGHLHVGSVRSAMFNWLFAKHNNGTYLLRIEDTDRERSKQEYFDSILHSFNWLNMVPDEPLVIQSERIKEHLKAAEWLRKNNLAYPCFCEAEDADKKIAELEQGIGAKYAGTCRDALYSEEDLKKPHAIRFKIPTHLDTVSFDDIIRGKITTARDQLDDFVIVRRDGSPTYNFVVVIDDIFMNISHIIRGEDHISNTPKQLLLYHAFKKEPPLFAHVPMILGPAGNRLSKRDAAVSVEEYRALGYLPEALFNYLVRLGWSHGDQELFTKEELISYFTLEKIGKKGSIFDLKKLQWVNSSYLRQKGAFETLQAIEAMSTETANHLKTVWSMPSLLALLSLYKDRATVLSTLATDILNLAQSPTTFDCNLLSKWYKPYTLSLIERFLKELEITTEWDLLKFQEISKIIIESENAKIIELAQPLRLAITGSIQSPGIFEIIEALGKEKTIERIKALYESLKNFHVRKNDVS